MRKTSPARRALAPESVRERQRRFFDGLAPEGQWQWALNHLDDTRVVIKDLEGRFVWVTDNASGRHGLTPDEMVGKHDSDINPSSLAKAYSRDDRAVMKTGQPVLGQVEAVFNEFGLLDWFVVNKLPLRNRAGEIVGLIATIQKHPGMSHLSPLGGEIRVAVEHIHAHLGEPLRVTRLARLIGISTRQLERRFHAATGLSPTEFMIRARLAEACRQLRETDASIGDIALQAGFYDQSALTRQFRRQFGMTPRDFRRSRGNSVMCEGKEQ